ncbi:hypothetical protein L6R50_27925 [Myxococcota bacterium]|nr:hypothetical protein [Myxococcota bacterium]
MGSTIPDRPSRHELSRVWGYVWAIEVHRTDGRDEIEFRLRSWTSAITHDDGYFYLYLDEGQTVALAQNELLIDSMSTSRVVRIAYFDPGAATVFRVYAVEDGPNVNGLVLSDGRVISAVPRAPLELEGAGRILR